MQYDLNIHIFKTFPSENESDEDIINEYLKNKEKTYQIDKSLSNDIKYYLEKYDNIDIHKLIAIALTIAKMDDCKILKMEHFCEAFQYLPQDIYKNIN